jgi:hypothetical protein
MTSRELDTKLYLDYAAAWADIYCADDEFMAAVKPYSDACEAAKAKWDAIPECDAKDSACNNADEMCHLEKLFSYENKLAWYVAALSTYEFACDMA